MGKIETMIKAEIQRLARREIRATFRPLKREVRAMRLKVSTLVKGYTTLNRVAKEQIQRATEQFKLEATPEELTKSRLSPRLVRTIRKRLGISQKELAHLAGVTVGAVQSWESGRFRPKDEKKKALVSLRKLNRDDVKKLLQERRAG